MPWINRGNVLFYEGAWPFDEDDILQRIDELEHLDNGFNRPQAICRQLRETIATHLIQKQTVYQFSKWCDWPYKESEDKAKEISEMLFDGAICPRLYEERQRQTELLPNADALYQKWVEDLVGS